jgi:hypothetical protein
MNTLAKTLLCGGALVALATVPAVAGNAPAFHVTALHGGRVVNKTKIHIPGSQHLTYTFGVYTYLPASELRKTVRLHGTFYHWDYSGCTSGPPVKVTAQKKSQYGKIGIATETYSEGCPSGPSVFYGETYKLTNPDAKGKIDHFVSRQIFKFKNGGKKYKTTLNFEVNVFIQ